MRSVRALDNISFTDWFKSHGGSDGSIKRMWDPIGNHGMLTGLSFAGRLTHETGVRAAAAFCHCRLKAIIQSINISQESNLRAQFDCSSARVCVCSLCAGVSGLRQHQCPVHAVHLPVLCHQDGRLGAAHAERRPRAPPAAAHCRVCHCQGCAHTDASWLQVSHAAGRVSAESLGMFNLS